MNRRIVILLCVFVIGIAGCMLAVYGERPLVVDCEYYAHQPAVVIPSVDSLMLSAIREGVIPGGVVCVTDKDRVLYLKAYGNRQVFPDTLPMTPNTIFDIASLSKPTSTAMCIFSLVADGKLSLDDYVSDYIPQIKDSFNITHLLTHTSGLPSYLNIKHIEKRYGVVNAQVLLDTICRCPRYASAGQSYRYSCLNFILLQHVIENIENAPLSEVAHRRIFVPLGMTHTCYQPDSSMLPLVAPTELMNNSVLLHGQVHDPLARICNGGISGNAGVFSCAEDLARLGRFLLANKNNQYVHTMTTVPDSLAFANRTLGWKHRDSILSCAGTLFGPNTYCHTGYTGTSMVVDPDEELCLIILTNRVHPKDKGNLNPLRLAVADAVTNQFVATNE